MVEFEEIPGEVICYLVESVEEIRATAGTAVIEKGDKGNAPIYIILKGKIEMTDPSGVKKILGRNTLFGDSKLLESEQFDIEAHCIEDCTMLLIRKEQLFNLMSMHIDIADIFIKIINHDFRKQEAEKFDLSIFN
jgi:AAA family ATP:ADP antiporter